MLVTCKLCREVKRADLRRRPHTNHQPFLEKNKNKTKHLFTQHLTLKLKLNCLINPSILVYTVKIMMFILVWLEYL